MLKHRIKSQNLKFYGPLSIILGITGLTAANLRTLPSSASDSVVSEISVTVQPSCTLTNESDLGSSSNSSIKTLQPGTYDPNIHTITLTSNCNDVYDSQIFAIGYTGCNGNNGDDCLASNANTNLIGQTSGATISGLTPFPTDGETNPTSFTTSGWYMKVSPNSTDTWQFTPENNFNTFHTIPGTSTLIAKTTITTNQIAKPTSTLTATYSAYASPSQAADTYEGKVKYTLISTPSIPTKYYIQNFTLNDCKVNVGKNGNSENIGDNITVYDLRDENDYTVRYINGYCWMTQNLRFVGDETTSTMTLSSTTSNIGSSYTENDPLVIGCQDLTLGNSIDEPRYHDSKDDISGVWYNYALASANTITGATNSDTATSDICPANWHLPTGPNFVAGTDLRNLFGNANSEPQDATAGLAALSTTPNGIWYYYYTKTDNGYWWTSTAISTSSRYGLMYEGSTNKFSSNGNNRVAGLNIRCVRTS